MSNRRDAELRKFGLTADDYHALYDLQEGACSICGGEATCVDHCHATGQVRGLLCGHCNKMLGFARDSIEVLTVAARYLKDWMRAYPDYCGACRKSGKGVAIATPVRAESYGDGVILCHYQCDCGSEWTCAHGVVATACNHRELTEVA